MLWLCPFRKGIWVVIQRRVRVDLSPVAINASGVLKPPCWCFCMQFPGCLPSLQIRATSTQNCPSVCGDFLLWNREFLQQDTWKFVFAYFLQGEFLDYACYCIHMHSYVLHLLCRFFTSVLQIECFHLTFIFSSDTLNHTNEVIVCGLVTQGALPQQIGVFQLK